MSHPPKYTHTLKLKPLVVPLFAAGGIKIPLDGNYAKDEVLRIRCLPYAL
jgi:hypothetical protein